VVTGPSSGVPGAAVAPPATHRVVTRERIVWALGAAGVGAAAFTLSNRDFNVRSFRSNVVLRWEWRPGSTLYAVWQQNRASSEPQGEHVGLGDLFGSLSAAGDNIFAIKTTFWLSR